MCVLQDLFPCDYGRAQLASLSPIGVPGLRDAASGRPIHILGIDHSTPRTQRTGETILVVDRADAYYVAVGRLWIADER